MRFYIRTDLKQITGEKVSHLIETVRSASHDPLYMSGRLSAVLHTVRTLTDEATTFNRCTTNGMHNKSVRVFSQFFFCEEKKQNILLVALLTVGIAVANLRGLLRIISRSVRSGPTHRY